MNMMNRYVGAMLGVAVGDALGAPYETMSAARVAEALESEKLGYFAFPDPFNKDVRIPSGCVTDDTEMTYALAVSLALDGFDVDAQFRAYRRLVQPHAVSSLTGHKPFGFGGLTKSALAAPSLEESMSDPKVPLRASNGALMRTAPVALFTAMTGDSAQIFGHARNASTATHRDQLAGDISGVYAIILASLLRNEGARAFAHARVSLSHCSCESSRAIISAVMANSGVDIGLMRGAALESFRIAIEALVRAEVAKRSFAKDIEWVIRKGGDTDTNAAIAGALLGAYYGVDSIPEHWRAGLYGNTRPRMETAAQELFDTAFANSLR